MCLFGAELNSVRHGMHIQFTRLILFQSVYVSVSVPNRAEFLRKLRENSLQMLKSLLCSPPKLALGTQLTIYFYSIIYTQNAEIASCNYAPMFLEWYSRINAYLMYRLLFILRSYYLSHKSLTHTPIVCLLSIDIELIFLAADILFVQFFCCLLLWVLRVWLVSNITIPRKNAHTRQFINHGSNFHLISHVQPFKCLAYRIIFQLPAAIFHYSITV